VIIKTTITVQTLYVGKYSVSVKYCCFCNHPFLSCTLYMKAVTQYEDVSRSFRTGRLERELQMIQLSATMCSYIAIL
jgi:hypothetical protein